MKKITHIIGTRPQIIKLAAIFESQVKSDTNFNHSVIDTNQHYEDLMQRNLYMDFNIDINQINFLNNDKINSNNISYMVSLLIPILKDLNPDIVFIYGDTTSTVAGAIAAKICRFPSIHIESGLRSNMSFQIEETNRIIVDNLSNFLFCPTHLAFNNLKREHNSENAYIVGDITLDIFLKTKRKKPEILKSEKLHEEYFVATIHRKENIYQEEKLINILKSLNTLNKVILPLHHSLKAQLINFDLYRILSKNIKIINPLVYSEMLYLVEHSHGVITDSGGLQKDAFWLEKPIITLRQNTEWLETLNNSQNLLIDDFPINLQDKISKIKITKFDRYSDFGNGNASKNILKRTEEILSC